MIGNGIKRPLQPTKQIVETLGLAAPRHFSLGVINSTLKLMANYLGLCSHPSKSDLTDKPRLAFSFRDSWVWRELGEIREAGKLHESASGARNGGAHLQSQDLGGRVGGWLETRI